MLPFGLKLLLKSKCQIKLTHHLQIRASSENNSYRVLNSMCNRGDVPLQPLVRELPPGGAHDPAIGVRPPQGTFPGTREALYEMTTTEIATLGAFYGVLMPGADERSRRDALAAFLGTPPIFHA